MALMSVLCANIFYSMVSESSNVWLYAENKLSFSHFNSISHCRWFWSQFYVQKYFIQWPQNSDFCTKIYKNDSVFRILIQLAIVDGSGVSFMCKNILFNGFRTKWCLARCWKWILHQSHLQWPIKSKYLKTKKWCQC